MGKVDVGRSKRLSFGEVYCKCSQVSRYMRCVFLLLLIAFTSTTACPERKLSQQQTSGKPLNWSTLTVEEKLVEAHINFSCPLSTSWRNKSWLCAAWCSGAHLSCWVDALSTDRGNVVARWWWAKNSKTCHSRGRPGGCPEPSMVSEIRNIWKFGLLSSSVFFVVIVILLPSLLVILLLLLLSLRIIVSYLTFSLPNDTYMTPNKSFDVHTGWSILLHKLMFFVLPYRSLTLSTVS